MIFFFVSSSPRATAHQLGQESAAVGLVESFPLSSNCVPPGTFSPALLFTLLALPSSFLLPLSLSLKRLFMVSREGGGEGSIDVRG